MIVLDSVVLERVVESRVQLMLLIVDLVAFHELSFLRPAGSPTQVARVQRTLNMLLKGKTAANHLSSIVVVNVRVHGVHLRCRVLDLPRSEQLADTGETLAGSAFVGRVDPVCHRVDRMASHCLRVLLTIQNRANVLTVTSFLHLTQHIVRGTHSLREHAPKLAWLVRNIERTCIANHLP